MCDHDRYMDYSQPRFNKKLLKGGCPPFSQKQSANKPKKYREMFFDLIEKQRQKIQALLKEKNCPKKSLTTVLSQAIQLCYVFILYKRWEN